MLRTGNFHATVMAIVEPTGIHILFSFLADKKIVPQHLIRFLNTALQQSQILFARPAFANFWSDTNKKAASCEAADCIDQILFLPFLRFQQLEELIQLRKNHDTRSAVRSFSFFCIVSGNWFVFATACSCNFSWVETIIFLQ